MRHFIDFKTLWMLSTYFKCRKWQTESLERWFPPPFLHGSREDVTWNWKWERNENVGLKGLEWLMTSGAQDRPASAEILCTATQAHFRRKARDVAKFAQCGRTQLFKEKKKMQQNITNCQFSNSTHVLQRRVLLLSLGNQGSAQTPNHYESSRFLLYGALKIMTSSLISI